MISSLSRRVKQIFIRVYLLSVSIVLISTWLLLEGLEETTLAIDKQAEIEHFLSRHETDKVVHAQSAMLTITYLPADSSPYEHLPVIFNNLPVPFDGDVEILGKEYRIIINRIPEGTYYLAKDLSQFEQYENLMVTVLLALAGLSIISGIGFASLISHRIAQPIQALTQDIMHIKQGRRETYLPAIYKDSELNEISRALNKYLDEIDQLVKRERSLITMASHELRTPIAVIMGAAEVIERRQQLNGDDQKTLQRIIASANTMSANVNVLLNLIRQSKTEADTESFSLNTLIDEWVAAIKIADPAASERIDIVAKHDAMISANRNMVRILFNNLVNNALNHNQGKVWIDFSNQHVEVRDQGIEAINKQDSETTDTTTGLGLYIVTLICEHLGWEFSLKTLPGGETCARVLFE